MANKQKVMYQGYFLDQESVERLRDKEEELTKKLEKNILEKNVTHPHITFKFSPNDEQVLPNDIVGKDFNLKVTGYGNDGKNSGFEVELLEEIKKYYDGAKKVHITTTLAEGAKAVDTCNLEFESIDPIDINGKMGLFVKGEPSYEPINNITLDSINKLTANIDKKDILEGLNTLGDLDKNKSKGVDR